MTAKLSDGARDLLSKFVDGNMLLWLVVQWGNEDEGGNGDDQQVIVRARSFDEALELSRDVLRGYKFKDGEPDIVLVMGRDFGRTVKANVYPYSFRVPALNTANWPSLTLWDGEWATAVEIYGDRVSDASED